MIPVRASLDITPRASALDDALLSLAAEYGYMHESLFRALGVDPEMLQGSQVYQTILGNDEQVLRRERLFITPDLWADIMGSIEDE